MDKAERDRGHLSSLLSGIKFGPGSEPSVNAAQGLQPRIRDMTVHEFGNPRVAHAGLLGDRSPITLSGDEFGSDGGFDRLDVHACILAILCYSRKQHFAKKGSNTLCMQKKPINDVLAENLEHFMKEKSLTQTAIANTSGIGQTTVSLYLHPERRAPGKSGKIPSAKLSEVESLADALGVDVWELLRPLTPAQRTAYKQIELAYRNLSGAEVEVATPTKSYGTSASKPRTGTR